MEPEPYPDDYRALMVEPMAPLLNNRPMVELVQTCGITPMTPPHWSTVEHQPRGMLGHEQSGKRWSSSEKFRMVLESFSMNEVELAQYCSAMALLPEQVERWRLACQLANSLPEPKVKTVQADRKVGGAVSAPNSPGLTELQKRIQTLERELQRKDAAMNAMVAELLTLGKKASAIWDNEEE